MFILSNINSFKIISIYSLSEVRYYTSTIYDTLKEATKGHKNRIENLMDFCEDPLLPTFKNLLKFDRSTKIYYKYEENGPNKGTWVPLDRASLFGLLRISIKNLDPTIKVDFKLLKDLEQNLQVVMAGSSITSFSVTDRPTSLVAFKNSVVRVSSTPFVLLEHNPTFNLLHKLGINYNPASLITVSLYTYLCSLCSFNPIRLIVLRAFLKLVITGDNKHQVALYLFGPGGSGKSTWERILRSIVPTDAVVAMNPQQLSDKFDRSVLVGKQLVTMGDIDFYEGDTSYLKQLVSGDILGGAIKFGPFLNITPQALLLITANQLWKTKDMSSGMLRRFIYLPCTTMFPVKDTFMTVVKDDIKLPTTLVEGLPGLVNWALSLPDRTISILFDQSIPDLNNVLSPSSTENTNPLVMWANQNLNYTYKEGQVAPLKAQVGNKSNDSQVCLYPNYTLWCMNHNYRALSHVRFTESLKDILVSQFGFKEVSTLTVHNAKFFLNIQLTDKPTRATLENSLFDRLDIIRNEDLQNLLKMVSILTVGPQLINFSDSSNITSLEALQTRPQIGLLSNEQISLIKKEFSTANSWNDLYYLATGTTFKEDYNVDILPTLNADEGVVPPTSPESKVGIPSSLDTEFDLSSSEVYQLDREEGIITVSQESLYNNNTDTQQVDILPKPETLPENEVNSLEDPIGWDYPLRFDERFLRKVPEGWAIQKMFPNEEQDKIDSRISMCPFWIKATVWVNADDQLRHWWMYNGHPIGFKLGFKSINYLADNYVERVRVEKTEEGERHIITRFDE